MLLNDHQLYQIREIIQNYHEAFIVSAIGPEAVAGEILEKLKKLGLVNPQVNFVEDAYLYGQLLATLENPQVARMSYPEFKAYLSKNPIPLSAAEKHAVSMARHQGAQYVRGLGNRVDVQTGNVLIEADHQLRQRLESDIREKVSENIAKRETIKKLKSDLGWKTRDWARDWDRIAITEKQSATLNGQADHYRKRHGSGAQVAKRSMPDACPRCKALYNSPDGYPRIFRLEDLQANATNVGRKANDWLPTVGPIHPNCVIQGTRVVAKHGEVAIEELRPGDEVFTELGRLRLVTHVWGSRYQGLLVHLQLLNGRHLSVTANHPLLTQAGWKPAQFVNQDDQLFQLDIIQLEALAIDLNAKQMPALAGQNRQFAAIVGYFTRGGVPVTAIYFDGELYVREGQIDISILNGEPGKGLESFPAQSSKHTAFSGRLELTSAGLRAGDQLFTRTAHTADGAVGILSELLPSSFTQALHANGHCFAHGSGFSPCMPDTVNNDIASDIKNPCYFLYSAQLVEVEIQDQRYIQFNPHVMSVSAFPAHECPQFGYQPIANVSLSEFSGVVYNLTVEEDHTYLTEGVVSHNCQCVLVRIPDGWGYNEEGELVPGGEFGKSYASSSELRLALLQENDLQKSYQIAGKVNFQGLPITIETPVGGTRKWRTADGEAGETVMQAAYGFIERTEGADGDGIDVFLGPWPDAPKAFVIHQQNPKSGLYDEDKVFLGFTSKEAAETCYSIHYTDPESFFVTTSEMDMEQFKRWAQATKPIPDGMLKKHEGPRLIIPLEKSAQNGGVQVSTEIGGATGMAVARNPGPGTMVNYLLGDAERHTAVPSRSVPEAIALTTPRAEQEVKRNRKAIKRDKRVYLYKEPLPVVPRKLEGADTLEAQSKEARKGSEERHQRLVDNYRRNVGRPKNKPISSEPEDEEKPQEEDEEESQEKGVIY